jgi:ferric-dicitrate binding protein FerR (iron transport regulator)
VTSSGALSNRSLAPGRRRRDRHRRRLAIPAALWSAFGGVAALSFAQSDRSVNPPGEDADGSKRRLLALALTLFAVVGVLVMVALDVARFRPCLTPTSAGDRQHGARARPV